MVVLKRFSEILWNFRILKNFEVNFWSIILFVDWNICWKWSKLWRWIILVSISKFPKTANRNQCKNLVGWPFLSPKALEERIFLEKRYGHADPIFRLITMAQTVFKNFEIWTKSIFISTNYFHHISVWMIFFWRKSFSENLFLRKSKKIFEIWSRGQKFCRPLIRGTRYENWKNWWKNWWNDKWKIPINSLEFRSVEIPSYSVHTVWLKWYDSHDVISIF